MAGPRITIPNAPDPSISYTEDLFVYEVQTASGGLAAAASVPLTVNVQADSHFKLIKLAHATDIAAAAQTESTRVLPLVTLQLTDTGSGRQLFNAPVPMMALFGDGRIPFILPIARIFQARSTIQLQLTNYSAATTYNVYIALIGTKLFPMQDGAGHG